MDTRKVTVLMLAYSAALIAAGEKFSEGLEKLMSADGGEEDDPPAGKNKAGKGKGKDKDDDDGDGDEPTEEDIVKVARKALKALDSAEVKKILKKHGKAERATEVEPENRAAAIEALEAAIDNAD